MSAAATPLEGGTANRGLVVRVGDTVRKPAGPAARGVRALLRHLEAVGFDGAPRHLGVDDEGREVLSFVEGEVALPPYPAWALSDESLASVARLLRRYHDAAAGFDHTPYAWPLRVPRPWGGSLVTHNDPNLDNVVFRDGRAVALIDFDLAGPARPVWDVALAARLWVPLRDPVDVPAGHPAAAARRLALFAASYGLGAQEARPLVAAALASHRWSYDIIRAGAGVGRAGYAAYWTPGAQAHDARGLAWLEAHAPALGDALAAAVGGPAGG